MISLIWYPEVCEISNTATSLLILIPQLLLNLSSCKMSFRLVSGQIWLFGWAIGGVLHFDFSWISYPIVKLLWIMIRSYSKSLHTLSFSRQTRIWAQNCSPKPKKNFRDEFFPHSKMAKYGLFEYVSTNISSPNNWITVRMVLTRPPRSTITSVNSWNSLRCVPLNPHCQWNSTSLYIVKIEFSYVFFSEGVQNRYQWGPQ